MTALCPCGCGRPPRPRKGTTGPLPTYASRACMGRKRAQSYVRKVQIPRACPGCNEPFMPHNAAHVYCSRSCAKSDRYQARKLEPELRESARETYLRSTYGITTLEYQALLDTQAGCCAICRASSSGLLHVDHDHDTGVIRGLLCRKCNMAIGLLKDSPALLAVAITYLQRSLHG